MPGCLGGEEENSLTDFCVLPEGSDFVMPTATPTASSTESTTGSPTGSPTTSPTASPSESATETAVTPEPTLEPVVGGGGAADISESEVIYTFNVTGVVTFVGNNDLTEPLALCEGDCDSDDDVSVSSR